MSLNNINLPRVLATSGAIGLVLASSGFGAFYAYTVGIQHGIVLAGLSVLMALALEAVKPLAIAAGVALWRTSVVGSSLLLTLGGISCAYSLTAELSLISMSKGDLVAERQSQATDASNAARDRIRIELELQTIGVTRPSAAIQAELDGGVRKSRIAPLKAELATAERREKLEGKLNGLQTIAPKVADPGSVALAGYLSALGFKPDVEKVGLWLLLVPVLALVQAFPSSLRSVKDNGLPSLVQEVVQAQDTGPEPARERVKAAIVDHLKANGGTATGGERGIAKLIGSNRGTMKRALQGLVLAGIVMSEATRNGTIIRLVN
jgi:hypothetical protein